MSNFSIHFSHPWLLLLLIPAVALTLIPYFLLAKKYRRTRNRITSMVLHTLIMLFSISVLAGITFIRRYSNAENEIILLVDVSYSSQEGQQQRDDFVKSIIDAGDEQFKMGIVTFGYGQVYAAELGNDADSLYRAYLNARNSDQKPDDSATDIASALEFASGLFTNPETGKIVIVSDGMETDGNAVTAVRTVAAEGIRVDTVHYPSENPDEVQILDVAAPDYNVEVGVPFNLDLTVWSSVEGSAQIKLYDNDRETESGGTIDLTVGNQTYQVEHVFEEPGLHELHFEITNASGDTLTENNRYFSYIYLLAHDRILIIERNTGESEALESLLKESEYKVRVVNIREPENFPAELDELREYEQVILVNISNEDLSCIEGFDHVLQSYVYDVGGGLFTVGGNQVDVNGNTITDGKNPIPNAYNREDMRNTLYQQMLPVQAVDYTPPLGVVFIIDRSGSMNSGTANSGGETKLELAKQGAMACVNSNGMVLTERDFVGVMTLESSYSTELQITPMSQMSRILEAINDIDDTGGGTSYAGAIERAGRALASTPVERKHIILISDAQPGDSYEQYSKAIQDNINVGITMSIVTVDHAGKLSEMDAAATLGGGEHYDVSSDILSIASIMAKDLTVDSIKEVVYEPFQPRIDQYTSIVNGIHQEDLPDLMGYYGTKKKEDATVVLYALYAPLYAQWKYGEGTVGSFMCDLKGTPDSWSYQFMADGTGRQLILNIVSNLFPVKDIRAQDIDAALYEQNYRNQISIFSDFKEDDVVEIEIVSPPGADGESDVQILKPAPETGYSRIPFTVTRPGIHRITIRKLDAAGTVRSEFVLYKTFSYSAEYNVNADREQGVLLLEELAQRGKGVYLESGDEENLGKIFSGFVTSLEKVIDPRLGLIITAIVLFLLDIAVRKFKFKWPHELIRERREKKEMNEKRERK